MSIQVYGIPTCGTCKKALQWLEQNGLQYEFVNTKQHPPSRGDIQQWVAILGSKPMRNTSGQSYRSLGEDKKTWSDEQWIEAFTADPMLLKRPLFIKNGMAILVGFNVSETILREKLGI